MAALYVATVLAHRLTQLATGKSAEIAQLHCLRHAGEDTGGIDQLSNCRSRSAVR
jgi:hypothetical protein